MRLMKHPAITHLFDNDDFDLVESAILWLTREGLTKSNPVQSSLYNTHVWKEFAAHGFFRFGRKRNSSLENVHAAKAVAMTADALSSDPNCCVNLAIYVQGIAAGCTLSHYREHEGVKKLESDVQGGEKVICTLYTDKDPAAPCTATRQAEGHLINGTKWLSINSPDADVALITFNCEGETLAALLPMDTPGLSISKHERLGGFGYYSQGEVLLEDVEIHDKQVLGSGLRRLRVWNRVMSLSRLLNTVSVLHELQHQKKLLIEAVSTRPIGKSSLGEHISFKKWLLDADDLCELAMNSIGLQVAGIAAGRYDESGIAGLKAHVTEEGYQLSAVAASFVGGESTVQNCEIAVLSKIINCHRFSSGAVSVLNSLYSRSIARRLCTSGEVAVS